VQGLQELGWTDGRNVQIDYRWPAGDAERIRRYAAELAALAPDIILAGGGAVVPSLLQATRAIPIVFTQTPDPVGAGFVESLARPGGNVTGFMLYEYGIGAKWLELLKEIAPHVTRAAVIRDAAIASGIGQWGAIQTAAPSFGVELRPVDVRDASEIERAIAAFARSPNGGLIVAASTLAVVHSRSDCHARGPPQTAGGVPEPFLRQKRRPDLLRARFSRAASPRSWLRRSHLEGREARRPPGAGADEVRAGDQSQDGESARPRSPADTARPRRRGDRMTRHSPRAGGSSQERPRLAGKEPGAYRATTMFVHFRETPYGLAMSLVENRRENGRICHEHVASLGSIETPPSVAARIEFWRGLHERLTQLSNRLDAETRDKVMVAVHARVPMVTPEEQRAS